MLPTDPDSRSRSPLHHDEVHRKQRTSMRQRNEPTNLSCSLKIARKTGSILHSHLCIPWPPASRRPFDTRACESINYAGSEELALSTNPGSQNHSPNTMLCPLQAGNHGYRKSFEPIILSSLAERTPDNAQACRTSDIPLRKPSASR